MKKRIISTLSTAAVLCTFAACSEGEAGVGGEGATSATSVVTAQPPEPTSTAESATYTSVPQSEVLFNMESIHELGMTFDDIRELHGAVIHSEGYNGSQEWCDILGENVPARGILDAERQQEGLYTFSNANGRVHTMNRYYLGYTEVEFTDPRGGGASMGVTGVNPVLVCDSIEGIRAMDLFVGGTFPLCFDEIATIPGIEVSMPQLNVVAENEMLSSTFDELYRYAFNFTHDELPGVGFSILTNDVQGVDSSEHSISVSYDFLRYPREGFYFIPAV